MHKNLGGLAVLLMLTGAAQAHNTVWVFDNLDSIGGLKPRIEGHPKLIASPAGKAVAFNGVDDALFFPARPLVGAHTFTLEAIIRPDGGAFEQRWLHLAQTDPATGRDAPPTGTNDNTPRFLMEVRVVKDQWYLDTYAGSRKGTLALAFPQKLHPVGHWYQVAQVYDGKTVRSYVDGVEQGEGPLPAFEPHGPGHASVGVRINHINYFHGAVREARFTDRPLTPDEFLKAPR